MHDVLLCLHPVRKAGGGHASALATWHWGLGGDGDILRCTRPVPFTWKPFIKSQAPARTLWAPGKNWNKNMKLKIYWELRKQGGFAWAVAPRGVLLLSGC